MDWQAPCGLDYCNRYPGPSEFRRDWANGRSTSAMGLTNERYVSISTAVPLLFALLTACSFILGSCPPSVVSSEQPEVRGTVDGRASHISAPRKALMAYGAAVMVCSYVELDGEADHIVAAEKYPLQVAKQGLLGHIYPEIVRISEIPTVGYVLDTEEVIRTAPDVILTSAPGGEVPKFIEFPRVVVLDFDLDNRRSRFDSWQRLGTLLGKEQRTREILKKYSQTRELLDRSLRATRTPMVTVAVAVGGGAGWSLGGKNYFLNDRLQFAGATNVGSNLAVYPTANLEELLVLNPESLLLNSLPGDTHFPEELYSKPQWQVLRAVRNRRVYKMPVYSFMGGPLDDSLLLLWMAEVFHPEAFTQGLRETIKDVYSNAYGYDISDEEIDEAIFYTENKGSVGYERFGRHDGLTTQLQSGR